MTGSWGVRIALCAGAWLAGVALPLQQARLAPVESSALWGGLALVVLAGLAAAKRLGRPAKQGSESAGLAPWLRLATLCVALAVLGASSTAWRAQLRLAEQLPAALEGVELVLTGRVADLPVVDAEGLRFALEVEQAWRALPGADGPAVTVPARVWLSWNRGGHDEGPVTAPPPELHSGERWRLPVRLKRPHGLMNPHGHDVELWMWDQGYGASGTVRQASALAPQRLAGPRGWRPLEALGAWRQSLRDQMLVLGGPAGGGFGSSAGNASLLAALAVGDQAAIGEADWDVYRQTGIAHLVSISGLHITLFAALAAGPVAWLWRRSGRAMLWLPAPMAGRWGGCLLALTYALLAGWGVPAQRTVLMLLMAVGLRSLGPLWPGWLVCLLAAAAVSLADPWALLQSGFWLSFVAVALLMLSSPRRGLEQDAEPFHPPATWRERGLAQLHEGLRSQWVASLGLAPLSMVFFQQVSVVGLLANLMAVPWVTLVITPLALAGMVWAPAWQLALWAIAPLRALLQALASMPGAVWTAAAVPPGLALLGLVGGAMLVLPLGWRWRGMGLALLVPLLSAGPTRPPEGQFELLAVDVGQGSAVLVRTAGHVLLHDAGPQFSRDSDAGRRVLLPLLQALGESGIDELILSHRDLDHVGGAAVLMDRLKVRHLRSSLEREHPLRRRAGSLHEECAAGQSWTWDGVRFDLLHPLPGAVPVEKPLRGRSSLNPNALSCVLRVQDAQGRSALLTGDIEAAQEAELVQRLGPALRSTLLVVPHHGSRTSSTDAFLKAVSPELSVMQQGYFNRFGHPHPQVQARYKALDLPVVRSDRCGALWWREGRFECTRSVNFRHWNWQPSPQVADPSVLVRLPDGGAPQPAPLSRWGESAGLPVTFD